MSLPVVVLTRYVLAARTIAAGNATISGTTKILGVAAPCRVFLFDLDGRNVGFVRTGTDGLYTFAGLAAGQYTLVILDDKQDTKRGKVEHILLV